MKIVLAENLYKSFRETEGRLEVLKGLNLSVKYGESVSITGESGCGKSTLLHLLGLLDAADSGSIHIAGENVDPRSKKADTFRNHHIGFVFQFHYLLPDFNAQENIALPHFYLQNNKRESIKRARNLLEKLDLLPRAEHYPHQLSGGEQQRIAFARALINEPDVVFLDEPTGNLDKRHSDELIELMLQLQRERNQSMIVVTHDQNLASLMQKEYLLENGVLHLQKK